MPVAHGDSLTGAIACVQDQHRNATLILPQQTVQYVLHIPLAATLAQHAASRQDRRLDQFLPLRGCSVKPGRQGRGPWRTIDFRLAACDPV
jgi:hypothetical protein